MSETVTTGNRRAVWWMLPVLLVFPLFLQLKGTVFQGVGRYYDSGGRVTELPLPVSILACGAIILLFAHRRRAALGWSMLLATCALMLGTSLLLAWSESAPLRAKLLLLAQYALPMFGLIAGQLYAAADADDNAATLERAFLGLLLVIVPAQLLLTWLGGEKILTPSLYLFSIHQHLQYAPTVLVAAGLIALWRLWPDPRYRRRLALLILLMAVYTPASLSMLSIGMLLAGLAAFALFEWGRTSSRTAVVMLLVAGALSWGYLQFARDVAASKFTFLRPAAERAAPGSDRSRASTATVSRRPATVEPADDAAMPNVRERLHYWRFYVAGVFTSSTTLLFGHATPPDRREYPSAHNYYLDLVYNFGALALVPFLALLGVLATRVWRTRHEVLATSALLGLIGVVLFLVLGDNALKVGLRQPYPGIFTYFLMGVLLTRLGALDAQRRRLSSVIADDQRSSLRQSR